jgi:cytochrome P450
MGLSRQKEVTSLCSPFSIQTDGELFVEPFNFDPFRYSRIREASAATSFNPEKESDDNKDPAPNLSFIFKGFKYLPFGHGKHACPGRYLVDIELKMRLV